MPKPSRLAGADLGQARGQPASAPPSPHQMAPSNRSLLISNSCQLCLAKTQESKLLWIDYSGTHPSPCTDSGRGAQDRGREKEQKGKCGPTAGVGTSGATCGLVMVVTLLLAGLPTHLRGADWGLEGGGQLLTVPRSQDQTHVLAGLRPLDPRSWPFPERRQWAGGGREGRLVAAAG